MKLKDLKKGDTVCTAWVQRYNPYTYRKVKSVKTKGNITTIRLEESEDLGEQTFVGYYTASFATGPNERFLYADERSIPQMLDAWKLVDRIDRERMHALDALDALRTLKDYLQMKEW